MRRAILRGRTARILALTAAAAALAVSTAGPALANNNDLRDGSCGYLVLTNNQQLDVISDGLGYDVTMGGVSTEWCIGTIAGGNIKFHQRVNGAMSSRVLQEGSNDIIFLATNQSGVDAQKFNMASSTFRGDLAMGTSPFRTLYTYGNAGDVVRTINGPRPPNTWDDWWYSCQQGC